MILLIEVIDDSLEREDFEGLFYSIYDDLSIVDLIKGDV